jgi:hypothetical protein
MGGKALERNERGAEKKRRAGVCATCPILALFIAALLITASRINPLHGSCIAEL